MSIDWMYLMRLEVVQISSGISVLNVQSPVKTTMDLKHLVGRPSSDSSALMCR